MEQINATHEDQIRISFDFKNGRSVTLTGTQWLSIYDKWKEAQKLFGSDLPVGNGGLCTWCGGFCKGGHPYD